MSDEAEDPVTITRVAYEAYEADEGATKDEIREIEELSETVATEEIDEASSNVKDPLSIASVMRYAVSSSNLNAKKRPRIVIDNTRIVSDNSISNVHKKDKKIQKRAPFPHTTYEMINNCDPDLAEWTSDGEMFVVKDPEKFSKEVIPEYFDHSKFESFTRQLNFYGFNKVESKVMRIKDIDQKTVNHVTFYNEYFKRNRKDLLGTIQRSTNRGKSQLNHIETLEAKVVRLSEVIDHVQSQLVGMEGLRERVIALELKLSQQNQLESTEETRDAATIYLQSSKTGTHTMHNTSSNFMKYNNLDSSVSASKPSDQIMHTTHSSKDISALTLLSEISNERKLDESMNHKDRIQPNSNLHSHTVHRRDYSIPPKYPNRIIPPSSTSQFQHEPSMESLDSNPIIDRNENDRDRTTVTVTDELSLNALQSGIAQFWQTLVNENK